MLKQRTLKTTIKTTGVGLHTGARVELMLRPAAPDTGIVFHRVDLAQPVTLPADARHVGDTRLSSTLRHDGTSISTVEHVMSALAGLGIDNLHIDVAGPEIPIMDGSAAPFVFLLQSAGIVEQDVAKKYLRIVAPVEVRDGDKWARFDPFNGFKLDFTIDFPHPMFGSENRHVVIDFAEHSYVQEVARARTFGFMQDVEAMRAAGLGLGRQPAERGRARRLPRAEHRGPALRQRVRQAQGARRDRRPLPARAPADRPVHGVQVGPRAQQRARPRAARAARRVRARDVRPRTTFPRRSRTGSSRRPDRHGRRRRPPSLPRGGVDSPGMVLVRLLLFLALAAIAVAGLLYLCSRDRRYLRFIGQVVKFTIILRGGHLRFLRVRAPGRPDALTPRGSPRLAQQAGERGLERPRRQGPGKCSQCLDS